MNELFPTEQASQHAGIAASNPLTSDPMEAIRLVEETASQFGINSLKANLEACKTAFATREMVSVAIVGGFKAGKSTFLNAIAKSDLLPVGVLPVTSVVTRLASGTSGQATVTFNDGRVEKRTLSEAVRYISEAENPQNRCGVLSVDIECPALEEFAGIQFVDTPGLGSAFAHNTETSMRWLPNIGVAVLATSANQPMSEADLLLLRDLHRHTPKIVVLVTKIDLLSADELQRVLTFVADQTQSCVGEAVSIFPFSVKPGWEDKREQFVNEVLVPLHNDRSEVALEILRHKIFTLVTECMGYLEVGLAAAARRDLNSERLQDLVRRERDKHEQFHRELLLTKRDLANRVLSGVSERTDSHYFEIEARLASEFHKQARIWRNLNLWKFARAVEHWLDEQIRREMAAVNATEEKYILGILDDAEKELGSRVDGFRGRLALALDEALGARLHPSPWRGHVTKPERPDVSVGWAFDIGIDLLWFIIPMQIFGPLIVRRLAGRIPWEVRKNLSRLSADWANAIQRRLNELEHQAVEFVNADLEAIEKLLLQRSEHDEVLAQARGRLLEVRSIWNPD